MSKLRRNIVVWWYYIVIVVDLNALREDPAMHVCIPNYLVG